MGAERFAPRKPAAPVVQRRKVKQSLPPVDRRYCVREGLAVVTPGGVLRYDWPKIRALWHHFPNASLADFARVYDLPYEILRAPKYGFDVRWKRKQLAERGVGFRDEVYDRLKVIEAERVDDLAKSLSATIDRVHEIAAVSLSYVRGKLVKRTDNGDSIPNLLVSASDVSRMALIAQRASETLRNVVDMRSRTGDSRERTRVVPVLAPNIRQAKGAADDKVQTDKHDGQAAR